MRQDGKDKGENPHTKRDMNFFLGTLDNQVIAFLRALPKILIDKSCQYPDQRQH